jgi:NadR type nicotinamide-nucleotide adenylyltransferase
LNKIVTIVIVGPESTGKSEMCKHLAKHYETVFVPEFAREYLKHKSINYLQADLIEIAKGQKESLKKLLPLATKIIFVDTDEIVLQVWSEVKYNACDKYILDAIVNSNVNFYLLMNIDLPWQYDALRESPDLQERQKLMLHYQEILQNNNIPFALIKGIGDVRNANAIKAMEDYKNSI